MVSLVDGYHNAGPLTKIMEVVMETLTCQHPPDRTLALWESAELAHCQDVKAGYSLAVGDQNIHLLGGTDGV